MRKLTVEAEVYLVMNLSEEEQHQAGASTGELKHLSWRDQDKSRLEEKGVFRRPLENINTAINDALAGMDASDIWRSGCCHAQSRDGTKDKSKTGRKLPLCFYCVRAPRAVKISLDIPYRFSGGWTENRLGSDDEYPNGGAHVANTADVQEFMIMPAGAPL